MATALLVLLLAATAGRIIGQEDVGAADAAGGLSGLVFGGVLGSDQARGRALGNDEPQAAQANSSQAAGAAGGDSDDDDKTIAQVWGACRKGLQPGGDSYLCVCALFAVHPPISAHCMLLPTLPLPAAPRLMYSACSAPALPTLPNASCPVLLRRCWTRS